MRRLFLVVLVLAGLCFGSYSETNTWLVSKGGNNGNPGAPTSDPVNLATDSFLTIGAAVSAAANGDKIFIWPGTYAEAIAPAKQLEVIGVGPKWSIIISPASGTPITLAGSDSNSIYRNIKAVGIGGSIGWTVTSASMNVVLEDCYAYGSNDGFYGGAINLTMIRCFGSSNWDGANLSSGSGILCKDSVFEGSNTSASAGHALQNAPSGKYINCDFIINDTQTTINQLAAVEVAGTSMRVIFDNCRFITLANSGRTGNVMGLLINHSTANVLVNGCVFDTNAVNAVNGAPDINVVSGTCVVTNSLYEKTSGTITFPQSIGSSGFSR